MHDRSSYTRMWTYKTCCIHIHGLQHARLLQPQACVGDFPSAPDTTALSVGIWLELASSSAGPLLITGCIVVTSRPDTALCGRFNPIDTKGLGNARSLSLMLLDGPVLLLPIRIPRQSAAMMSPQPPTEPTTAPTMRLMFGPPSSSPPSSLSLGFVVGVGVTIGSVTGL